MDNSALWSGGYDNDVFLRLLSFTQSTPQFDFMNLTNFCINIQSKPDIRVCVHKSTYFPFYGKIDFPIIETGHVDDGGHRIGDVRRDNFILGTQAGFSLPGNFYLSLQHISSRTFFCFFFVSPTSIKWIISNWIPNMTYMHTALVFHVLHWVIFFIFLQISVKLLRRGTTQEGELFQVGEAII